MTTSSDCVYHPFIVTPPVLPSRGAMPPPWDDDETPDAEHPDQE